MGGRIGADDGESGSVKAECVVGAILSYVDERERIFLRWLSEVERLLDHQVDRDAAFKAWTDGYSAAEYADQEVTVAAYKPETKPR